jgi:arabinose-5-phosphate isomerase
MSIQNAVRSAYPTDTILERGVEVIRTEAAALQVLASSLDETFIMACDAILASRGRVVITGMGKSGHIGRKWAATMAATGTPAIYVHPGEAAHGDLGMLIRGDVLIVISNSGNTSELRAFLDYAKQIGVPVIGVASRVDSLVMRNADIRLCLPPAREACPANLAPTTSTTMQLALGDAIAMALMDLRGFTKDCMRALHPNGSLGLRMTPVRDIMHPSSRVPLVSQSTHMHDVILTMTSMGFGIAGVVDPAGRLVGAITDGDLRRHFDDISSSTAAEVMTADPITVSANMLAEDALQLLNDHQITGAFVIEPDAPVNTNVPVGIVHVHDFLRLGVS